MSSHSHGNQTHSSQKTSHPIHPMKDQEMRECIENCLDCFESCSQLVPHCLGMGGIHANPAHIGMLLSCASICETSAKLMMYHSEFHHQTCGICAEICRKCADECETIAGDDTQMLACADLCRRSAETCEQMSQAQH